MHIKITPSTQTDLLVELLREADEDMARIREAVESSANTAYLATAADTPIGAAVVCWQPDESEIIYIAVQPEYRGQGYGKAMIASILDMGRQQGVKAVLVGTANSSLENIAFYQKCGFRMDSVRKNYFAYFTSPVYDNGILIQDMLVLRCDLDQ